VTLSGALMRRELVEREPMFGPWTVVSKRHDAPEEMDPRRAVAFQAPQYPGAPPVVETYVEPDTSPLIDQTPKTHTGTRRNPGMTAADRWAVHSASFGAEIPHTKVPGRFRKWTDRIVLYMQQDHTHPPAARDPGGRADLVRGLNAFPVNNPPKEMYDGEGWRRAWWQSRRDEHDLSIPTRHHRWRIVPRWVAAEPVDRAEQTDGGSIYTGLSFPGLSKSIKNKYRKPMMRRQPGYVGENVMSDGTEEPVTVSVGDFI
jgi:hypothetical protein